MALNVTMSRRLLRLTAVCLSLWAIAPCDPADAQTQLSREQYLRIYNEFLDGVIAQHRASAGAKLVFSANLYPAHGSIAPHVPTTSLIRYADGLVEAGVGRLDLNLGAKPWLESDEATIAKYDTVIERLRAANIQIAFNPQFSRGDVTVGRFEDWTAAALRFYPIIAARYRPDILILVHEPTTMAARMGFAVAPESWAHFVRRTAAAVKAVSPRTRLGVGGLNTETRHLEALLSLPEVEVFTMDIYPIRNFDEYRRLFDAARRAGKAVYIEETWRFGYPGDGRDGGRGSLGQAGNWGIGTARYQPLDSKWLSAMTLYASSLRLEAITPFWTPTFFKYVDGPANGVDPAYLKAALAAADRSERTETFHTFQGLIAQYGRR